jgi:hypothetical protein
VCSGAHCPQTSGARRAPPYPGALFRRSNGAQSDERTEGQTAAERRPLLPADESDAFKGRWREIQIAFVDEPRDSVAKADALVADLMQRLTASFSEE